MIGNLLHSCADALSCLSVRRENRWLGVEGLAGAGKTTLCEGLLEQGVFERLAPEIEWNGWEESGPNYVAAEAARQRELHSSDRCLFDRTVLSTVAVEAALVVVGANTTQELQATLEAVRSAQSLRLPSTLLFLDIPARISVERQLRRSRYRDTRSKWYDERFNVALVGVYSELLFELAAQCVEVTRLDASNLRQAEVLHRVGAVV